MKVVIAGAGGAAHLAGVIAAETTLPVIAVPIPSTALLGLDSLLAMVQMPAGIPVATVAIGKPGATNAGILAAQMIGLYDAEDIVNNDTLEMQLIEARREGRPATAAGFSCSGSSIIAILRISSATFSSIKFFLARDNIREVLVVR